MPVGCNVFHPLSARGLAIQGPCSGCHACHGLLPHVSGASSAPSMRRGQQVTIMNEQRVNYYQWLGNNAWVISSTAWTNASSSMGYLVPEQRSTVDSAALLKFTKSCSRHAKQQFALRVHTARVYTSARRVELITTTISINLATPVHKKMLEAYKTADCIESPYCQGVHLSTAPPSSVSI